MDWDIDWEEEWKTVTDRHRREDAECCAFYTQEADGRNFCHSWRLYKDLKDGQHTWDERERACCESNGRWSTWRDMVLERWRRLDRKFGNARRWRAVPCVWVDGIKYGSESYKSWDVPY